MQDLESHFHGEMIRLYEDAKRECNYNATYFLRLVSEKGGLKAAKQLLATDRPSDGFAKLWEYERLDLSVEARVLKPEFEPLFTEEERLTARRRLSDYGYDLDD